MNLFPLLNARSHSHEVAAKVTNAKLMHAATASGRVSAMARVLELGADINEGDCMFKTGFPTYALLRAIKTGKIEAVRFLLERGASTTKPGYDGLTPLEVVRMECSGGNCNLCRVHGNDIVPEIR
jgi:ankyrin repeat protein